jgi:hypothetical protein
MEVLFRNRLGAIEIVNPMKGIIAAQWREDGTGGRVVQDTPILSAALITAFGTPITVVPAPPAGYAVIFDDAVLYSAGGGTAMTIGSCTGLGFKYTGTSGLQVGQCAVTGFLDQTTAQLRYCLEYKQTAGASDITPVAAAPIVLQALTANMSAGNQELRVRAYYTIVPATLVF